MPRCSTNLRASPRAWPILYLACCRLGAIAVAVNTRFKSSEVADIVARSGAKLLACWPGFKHIDFLAILGEIDPAALATLQGVILFGEHNPAPPPAIARLTLVPYAKLLQRPPLAAERGAPDAACNIFTTSGTTRAPKFVVHRQGAIAAHAARVAQAFDLTRPGTRQLLMLPICGVFGFNQAFTTLAAGKTLHLMELFDAERAVAQFNALGITHLFATDEMIERMLALAPGELAFPSVRWGGYAGFNTSLADIVAHADRRGLKLVGLYGMSEIQAFFSTRRVADPIAARAEAGGHPVSPMAMVRARDPHTGNLVGHDREGELEIAGPSRMVGYFGDAEATRAGLTEDGFVRTGDLGRTAADGSFTFLTRMGDVLRLAGFLVSPAEIEAYLQLHPGVAASQVVALARPEGVRAVAFVVPRAGMAFDEAAVIEHCRKGLANYKVPLRVLAIDDFPRTPSANGFKIQRNKLRDLAEQRIDAASA